MLSQVWSVVNAASERHKATGFVGTPGRQGQVKNSGAAVDINMATVIY